MSAGKGKVVIDGLRAGGLFIASTFSFQLSGISLISSNSWLIINISGIPSEEIQIPILLS